MKLLILAAALLGATAIMPAAAAVTCIRYGNSVTCTGSGGTATCSTYGNVTTCY
jgi:hypothetical protein